MEKLFLAIERQMFSCTAWNSKKIPHWTETNLSALHFKTSLQSKRCHCFYLHLWLVLGKNTQPSMAIMTVYRAVFCILPLDNSITSLSTGWPGQQRQISVWVHVNQWKMQFFCGGVAKCQLFSQAKGNFEIVELRALDVDNNQRLASSKSPLTTWTSLASVFR